MGDKRERGPDKSKPAPEPPRRATAGVRSRAFWLTLAILLLAAACLLQASAGWLSRLGGAFGEDDAYISYRYARNLAAGHGLVFNPGERVEGYSNFLYVVLLAPAFFFLEGTSRHIYAVSFGLNLLCAAGALWVFAHEVEARIGRMAGAAAATLFALLPVWWVWVAAGLETPMVVLLQLGVWSAASRIEASVTPRRVMALAALASLSVLSRPDGFIFPALAAAWLYLRGRRREAMIIGGATILVFAVHTGLRYLYYGYPLPNTYYAKVDGPLQQRIASAGQQLIRTLSHHWLWPYAAAFCALALSALAGWKRVGSGARRAVVGLDAILVGGWAVYWFYIGGDFMGERFLLPLIFICMASMLQLAAAAPRASAAVALTALAMAVVQVRLIASDPRFNYTTQRVDAWSELGRLLSGRHPAGTIAVDAAGKIPYYTGWKTIDMLGLNDTVIARRPAARFVSGHSKFDADEVLARRPDMIATWIVNDNLDLKFGLDRRRYEQAGYRIRYMQRVNMQEALPVVLDARDQPGSQAALAFRQGFIYGVLERRDAEGLR